MSAARTAGGGPGLVLGIGCTRGVPIELLERGVRAVLHQHGFREHDVVALASIELKRDEPGLLALSARHGWPLTFYSAEQLHAASIVAGERMRALVGSAAVAAPAALLCAGAQVLLVDKTIHNEQGIGSMTLAVARRSSRPDV